MNHNTRNLPGSNDMQDVSKPDVAKMSPADIQLEIDRLLELKAHKEQMFFNDALQDINNIIKTKLKIEGVNNIHDLSGYLEKNEAKFVSKKTKQRRAVTHCWQHRTNKDLRWTGRGQVIAWLRDEMNAAGKDPTDKEEVRNYCEENLDFISNNDVQNRNS